MRSAIGLTTLLLWVTLAPVVRGQVVTFKLAPEAKWNGGSPSRADHLSEGRVFLFREGTYRPEMVVPINQRTEVPPGNWFWIAEAEGFVTVVSGRIVHPAGAEYFEKGLVEPVVPACQIDLGEAGGWRGVTRLDVVSLDRSAVYPVVPAERRRFWVPAGRFLAYTVDARGVEAISPVKRCRAGEAVRLPRPDQPGADVQDLMVSVRQPAENADPDAELTAVLLPISPSKSAARPPTATFRAGTRATFFFLGATAREPLVLRVSHPGYMSHRQALSPLAGAVRELPAVSLVPRVALELSIDYEPGRQHATEELVLLHCGEEPGHSLIELDPDTCREIGEPRELVRGVGTYRFDDLDLGWYVPEARVDGEKVLGLGDRYSVFVDGESPPVIHSPLQKLREFHVFGHLLLDGEPVVGEARLEGSDGSLLRFPTDDELLYHLYYFGQIPTSAGLLLLPAAAKERPEEELLGRFDGYSLRACDEEGFCRLFHRFSSLSGDGRLDLDLGAARELFLRVVDADTEEPIAEALATAVRKGDRYESFHFVAGETFAGTMASPEARVTLTNLDGEVKLRDLAAGPQRLTVFATGYDLLRRNLDMPEQGRLELEVRLDSGTGVSGGPVLRFPDRSPLASAYLQALTPDGSPDPACSRATGADGAVRVPEACLAAEAGRRFLVLHPGAVLELLPSARLRQSGEIEMARADGLPVRLRLLDGSGAPLRGRPISLRFSEMVLSPRHLTGARLAGQRLSLQADRNGELTLPHFDPRWSPPEVGVIRAVDPDQLGSGASFQGDPAAVDRWLALPAAAPGELIELRLD